MKFHQNYFRGFQKPSALIFWQLLPDSVYNSSPCPQGKENHKSCKSDITSGHKSGSCIWFSKSLLSYFPLPLSGSSVKMPCVSEKISSLEKRKTIVISRQGDGKISCCLPSVRKKCSGIRWWPFCTFLYMPVLLLSTWKCLKYFWTAFSERTGFFPLRWAACTVG